MWSSTTTVPMPRSFASCTAGCTRFSIKKSTTAGLFQFGTARGKDWELSVCTVPLPALLRSWPCRKVAKSL